MTVTANISLDVDKKPSVIVKFMRMGESFYYENNHPIPALHPTAFSDCHRPGGSASARDHKETGPSFNNYGPEDHS
jgi:hypothetical protein